MNPADFLEIAGRFQSSESEGERRTSIGRSYYALFNVLVVRLSAKGVPFHEHENDHRLLAQYLKTSNHKDAYKISQNLDDLRLFRNDSDYKMTIQIGAQKSESAYKLAVGAIKRFDRLTPEELAQIVQSMKDLR